MLRDKNPLISVITVVKDDLDGVISTFRSLQAQNDFVFEWIVVDGSSNETIGNNLKSRKIEFPFIYARRNANGIYDAMNFSSTLARGDWIWFINASDFLLDESVMGHISDEIRILNAEMLATPVLHFTNTGYLLAVSEPRVIEVLGALIADFHHQGTLMKLKLFKELGGFELSMNFAADGFLLDSAIKKSKFDISKNPYVGFLVGGASTSNFAESEKEASAYRQGYRSRGTKTFLILKNSIRKAMLKHEQSTAIGLYIRIAFKLKESRLLRRSSFVTLMHESSCTWLCNLRSHYSNGQTNNISHS